MDADGARTTVIYDGREVVALEEIPFRFRSVGTKRILEARVFRRVTVGGELKAASYVWAPVPEVTEDGLPVGVRTAMEANRRVPVANGEDMKEQITTWAVNSIAEMA